MIRRTIQSLAVVALVASGSGLVAVAPASATAPTGFTPVASVDSFSGQGGTPLLECPTTGNCSAAFQTNTNTNYATTPPSSPTTGTKFFTQSNGTWSSGTAITPPVGYDFMTPSRLHCVSAGNCILVGTAGIADAWTPGGGYAVQANGTWGAGQLFTLPAGMTSFSPQSMSCGTATTCTVLGNAKLTGGAQVPAVVELTGSTWSAIQQISGLGAVVPSGATASLNLISCSSATDCAIVGSANNFWPAAHVMIVVNRDAGGWGAASTLNADSGITNVANWNPQGLACASPGNCTMVGSYGDSSWTSHIILAEQTNGTWSSIMAPPIDPGELRYITCNANGPCIALGYWTDANHNGHPLVVGAGDGISWNPIDLSNTFLTSGQVDLASCNANGCLVAGHQTGSGMAKSLAFGVGFTSDPGTATASWDLDRAVDLVTSEAQPACSADGTCTLVIQNSFGSYPNQTTSYQSTTYHPQGGSPSPKVTLSVSPDPGAYGTSSTITVNVKPTTIAGPVNVVNQNGRPMGHCYVRSGSCSFDTKALKAGQTDLTAIFHAPRPYGKVTGTLSTSVNAATMIIDSSGSDTSRDRWPATGVRKAHVYGKLASQAKECVRARSVEVKVMQGSSTAYGKVLHSSVTGRFQVRTYALQPGSYTVMMHVEPTSNCEAAEQSYDLTIN